METGSSYKMKLGMFVVIGLSLLVLVIFFIGKGKNMFGSTFEIKSHFKNVGGLKEGNNVRFSGITVGTVKSIDFVSDTIVVVHAVIQEDVQQYIKSDAKASIGSEGLMGDKVLTIFPGTNSTKMVADQATIASVPAVEMEELMSGVKKSVENAEKITAELALFTQKMNSSNGALSKLMTDSTFSRNIQSITSNIEKFTRNMNNDNNVLSKLVKDEKLGKSVDSTITGLNNTIEAAQNNFLLRGYINKKKKADAKKKKAAVKAAAAKANEESKAATIPKPAEEKKE